MSATKDYRQQPLFFYSWSTLYYNVQNYLNLLFTFLFKITISMYLCIFRKCFWKIHLHLELFILYMKQ